MNRIAVLTDSSAYLPQDLCQRHAIDVIPLTISWEGQTYRDGIDLVSREFYPRLDRSAALPTTSQPSPQAFLEHYNKLAADFDGIVAPLISSGISGTVAAALSAASEFSQVPVHIIDTHATAGGLAMITLATARAVQAGRNLDEVARIAQDISNQLHTYFMVDTLKYLHKGGRIGGASRFLGSALSIKPILFLNKEGKIDALERVRSKQKALARLSALVTESSGDGAAHISVYHASAPEEAGAFLDEICKQMNCSESLLLELSPVIGSHVGTGTIGVSVYTESK